jgi:hypothetical protein
MTFTQTSFALISLIAIGCNPADAKFGLPDNVNFVTHMYNTSNCSNTSSYKNITLHNFCYNTKMVNGYPECCHELLEDISLFDNVSFRQCVKTNMTFTNLTGLSYDCNMTKFQHFSKVETLSYVGMFSTILLGLLLLYALCMCITVKRSSYNKL